MSHQQITYLLTINDQCIGNLTRGPGTLLETNTNELSIANVNRSMPMTIRSTLAENGPFQIAYSRSDHIIISQKDFQLLIPVKEHKRCLLYQDAEWMEEGRRMKMGDKVIILNLSNYFKVPGIIRYVGDIFDTTSGALHFGIELNSSYAGKGCSNGFFRSQRFECKEDCAVFCNLSRIRLARNTSPLNNPSNPASLEIPREIKLSSKNIQQLGYEIKAPVSSIDQLGLNIEEIPHKKDMPKIEDLSIKPKRVEAEPKKYPSTKRPFLEVGEKVVLLTESTAELGVVKWIGKLPGKGDLIYAGVNFKNPIGSGTGKFGDKQYFEAIKNHASFTPLEGLMRADDFGYPSEEAEEKDLMAEVIDLRKCGMTSYESNVLHKSFVKQLQGGRNVSKDTDKLMEELTFEQRVLLNLIYAASFVPKFKDPTYSESEATVRNSLHLYISQFLTDINHENVMEIENIRKILDRMEQFEFCSHQCTTILSLKLFRSLFGVSFTKYTLVKSPAKYVQLQDLLMNSEDFGLFYNHFMDDFFIYIVAKENEDSKNVIIPNLSLDFTNIFLSCHACKIYLNCPDCTLESKDSICQDCFDKHKSLRLSLFCENCYDVYHHHHGLGHYNKSGINTDMFGVKKPKMCSRFTPSSPEKRKNCIQKMKLFAIVTSTDKCLKTYGSTSAGKHGKWFAKEGLGEERDLPDFTSFLENYTTSPSTSNELHEMLDGMELCFFYPCD